MVLHQLRYELMILKWLKWLTSNITKNQPDETSFQTNNKPVKSVHPFDSYSATDRQTEKASKFTFLFASDVKNKNSREQAIYQEGGENWNISWNSQIHEELTVFLKDLKEKHSRKCRWRRTGTYCLFTSHLLYLVFIYFTVSKVNTYKEFWEISRIHRI